MNKYNINAKIDDVNGRYFIGDSVCKCVATDDYPLFRYDYLIVDNISKFGKFSFIGEHFKKEDYEIYFKKTKRFCCETINNLIDKCKKEDHFHIHFPDRKKDKKLIEILEHIGNVKLNEDKNMPNIGQFALYTESEGKKLPSDSELKKSPRIFFIIGKEAVFNIFCYDPFHELKPMPNF